MASAEPMKTPATSIRVNRRLPLPLIMAPPGLHGVNSCNFHVNTYKLGGGRPSRPPALTKEHP